MIHPRRPTTDLHAPYRGPQGVGLTHDQALEQLRTYVMAFKTQKDAALHLGMEPSYLTQILTGRKPIQDWLATALGLQRKAVSVYYFEALNP